MKVLVVGAGTMGLGIAQAFSSAKNSVILWDAKQDALEIGKHIILQNLKKQQTKGNISEAEVKESFERITFVEEFKPDDEIALVVEAVYEDLVVKQGIFKILDQSLSPQTIFASNTSSLSITELGRATSRPEKMIGVHFFNPVPLMRLVEVIRGEETSDETVMSVKGWMSGLNKEVIEVKESPAFVVNRMLAVLMNEAFEVLAEGLASPSDIDKALVLGANFPMGPLALADLVGLDILLAILNILYKAFPKEKYRPHPLLVSLVSANHLGRKTKKGVYDYR